MLFAIVSLLLSCNNDLGIPEADELKCQGHSHCAACKNYSSCEYCNSGGTCGICAPKKEKKENVKPQAKSQKQDEIVRVKSKK
jgi:hypothetical protein